VPFFLSQTLGGIVLAIINSVYWNWDNISFFVPSFFFSFLCPW